MASSESRIVVPEMVRDSTVNLDRIVVVPSSLTVDGSEPSEQPSIDFTQQIQELKKEQEMQKQMLWHTFNEKTKQLELQHKLELEHKIQQVVNLLMQKVVESVKGIPNCVQRLTSIKGMAVLHIEIVA